MSKPLVRVRVQENMIENYKKKNLVGKKIESCWYI